MNFGSFKKIADTSNTSICLALLVLVFICLLSKFVLDKYYDDNKDENWKNNAYAFIIGILFAVLSLIGYKQVNSSNNNEILTDPFSHRN